LLALTALGDDFKRFEQTFLVLLTRILAEAADSISIFHIRRGLKGILRLSWLSQVGLDHHLHLRRLGPRSALASFNAVACSSAQVRQLASLGLRGVNSLAFLAS